MTGPNRGGGPTPGGSGGHWERAWAILRQNARETVSKAPKESPALLFAVILLGLAIAILYFVLYAGSLV